MEHADEVYDVIVVGAGIEGSSTAYNLAKFGKRTLLLEQFPLPHSRGSSHGQSRITRKAYGSRDFYTQMMAEAFAMTDELQKECGEQLFINCGCLVIGPRTADFLSKTKSCLKRYGIPHDQFDIYEQRKRFPALSFRDDFEFVLDKSGGLLRSDKILQAFQRQFVRYGGVLCDGEPMIDLYPGTIVSVKTTKGLHRARSVVLTLGPWAAKFLPRLGLNVPLQPLKITVCYWKEKHGGNFNIENFPTFTMNGAAGKHHIYGLPACEYPGLVKICLHHGPNIDPDNRDGVENDWVLDAMKLIIATHFPSLEKEPSIVETCIYTNTPDEDFVLDVHPTWKNIVIGAGFSGHGFKLAPVVGKVLGELATGQKPSYDLSHFKINRFFKTKL
ncbi:peroxisomal sarcosine oxidase-like [Mercenaria mercenaria]|uniref:peroxisomal sarcosine oxidase-like n=1 Tax=Mercenaria mercenaria TaxID=6596 RepID=UPI00234E59C0|nr:peroxisomal sarcosine oxidase-like [Mercenaria mercenaria]XP_053375220.1 peroxisomal sarcosine oxidase-like [Mercenaria mercenaria]